MIAAIDAEHGDVVVDGWRSKTGASVPERISALTPYVGGFLFTQVEHEGAMGGFDMDAVREAVAAAGARRVTAAGGISTADDVAALEALGADAQVLEHCRDPGPHARGCWLIDLLLNKK